MTYPMAMQRLKLHIGNFPYVLDADDESDNHWFRAGIFKAASASYALLSGAHVLLPAVGHSVIIDPYTNTVAESRAKNIFADLPILYSAFNHASLLYSDETSDADAQVSWGTLQQINEAVPDAIPQVTGSLVPHHEDSVIQLKAANYTWTETGIPSEYDFEGSFVKA
jgi:nitrilase